MTSDDATKNATDAIPNASKWLAGVGAVAGIGAVIASSCCVIPLGLAAIGAGAGVFGGLEAFIAWRVPMLSVSALAIVGGWSAWWIKRPVACGVGTDCASPERSRSTLALLLAASIIVLAAASWSQIDPMLMKLLRAR